MANNERMLLNTADQTKEAILNAEKFLKTFSSEDTSDVKKRVVILQDTLFLGKSEILKSQRLFLYGSTVDEVWRNATFPNISAAYQIYGIEVDTDIWFGATKEAHYATLKQFLRLSKLEIKRNDVVIHEFPLANLVNFTLDTKVTVAVSETGESQTTTEIHKRTIKDMFNLNEYALKVSAGEKLDVTLKLDSSFTTSETLYSKLYNLPSEVTGKISNGQGNAIIVRLYAIEMTATSPANTAVKLDTNSQIQNDVEHTLNKIIPLNTSTTDNNGKVVLPDLPVARSYDVPFTLSTNKVTITLPIEKTGIKNIAVWKCGLRMKQGSDADYTVSENTITFAEPPHTDSNIIIDCDFV